MSESLQRPARPAQADAGMNGPPAYTPSGPSAVPPTGVVTPAANGAAEPVRPARASEFRVRSYRRDQRRRTVLGVLLVVGIVALGLFFAPGASLSGSQGASSGGSSPSGPSGSVTVNLGPATVATTTCSDGKTTTTEGVPWVSSSAPVSTSEIALELQELIDGDIDGGPTAYPSVSASYLCGAPVQSAWTSWYAVLQNPAGANIAFFSYSQGWVNLNQPGVGITIADGSTLFVLSDPSYAGLSFALCVLGDVGAPTINVCGEL